MAEPTQHRDSKRHSRHASSIYKAPLTRRTTKGPLDVDDPLAIEPPPTPSSPAPDASETPTQPTSSTPVPTSPLITSEDLRIPPKDFSYLQRPEIYHTLSQHDIPPALRSPALLPSTPLPTLLQTSEYRNAAVLAATTILALPPTSHQILPLFHTRLATLTLISGGLPLAARESTALEDVSSSFYRDLVTNAHIMPWELRVLVVRLQAIGYSDTRRSVTGYYELARDARIKVRGTVGEEKEIWRERLRDLGVRVGNALEEMGDLEGARLHFETLPGRGGGTDGVVRGRLALLCMRIGDLEGAKRWIGEIGDVEGLGLKMLEPLRLMAEGRYDDAVEQWTALRASSEGSENALITQNLAVCLLYAGRLEETRNLLESLVDQGHAFHALTFNLATVYELCTEKSRAKKTELVEKVASRAGNVPQVLQELANADFKL